MIDRRERKRSGKKIGEEEEEVEKEQRSRGRVLEATLVRIYQNRVKCMCFRGGLNQSNTSRRIRNVWIQKHQEH